jgi:hypothetical protein
LTHAECQALGPGEVLAIPWQHQPVDLDRRLNILKVGFAKTEQRLLDLVLDLARDVFRETDATRLGQRQDAGGNVDTISVDAGVLSNDVAKVQAYAELYLPVSRLGRVAIVQDSLDLHSALGRSQGTGHSTKKPSLWPRSRAHHTG